jgi:Fe2+ or Zn2+ uptake regulation protein
LKNVVLISVIVLVLGAAAYFLFRGDPEGSYSSAPETKTHWICCECGKQFELTAKELEAWVRDPQKARRQEVGQKQAVLWCDVCKAFTICRAAYCSQHKLWYPECDPDGKLQACPACKDQYGEP